MTNYRRPEDVLLLACPPQIEALPARDTCAFCRSERTVIAQVTPGRAYRVECRRCGCAGPGGNTRCDAVDGWNLMPRSRARMSPATEWERQGKGGDDE